MQQRVTSSDWPDRAMPDLAAGAGAAVPAGLVHRLTPGRSAGDRGRVWLGLVAAVCGHAAALALVLVAFETDRFGAGGTELEAISVTIVDGSALAAREVARPIAAIPAAAMPLAAADGALEASAEIRPQAVARPDPQPGPLNEPNREPVPPEPAASVADAAAPPADPAKMLPQEQPVQAPRAAAVAAAPGGASASGAAAASVPVAAAAAASPGVLRAYAASVSTALRQSEPKADGSRGSVKVAFTIAADGSLEADRVVTSSGDARLDKKALDALRGARFREPPAGMTAGQRSFEIAYRFK